MCIRDRLYLVFNEGYSGDIDLVAEAIRLTRQLAGMTDHPEAVSYTHLTLPTNREV